MTRPTRLAEGDHPGVTGMKLRRLRPTALLAAPFALYALLRVPSFLEPHWYTDEAGYASTASQLLRGRGLYGQIWNNKPPLHLWTVAADIWAFGTSEAGLHVVTFISGLVAMLGVLYVARPFLGTRRALIALFVVAVLLGTPLFDAELTIPESLLIAPATWAGAIVLRNLARDGGAGSLRWPVVAGLCAAMAIAYQQTAVADAAALGLILVVSPAVRLRQVVAFVGTVVAVTAAWVGAAVLSAGAATVGFALGGFYVAYTQAMLPTTVGGLLRHAAVLAVCIALIVGGALMMRRAEAARWAPWVWAGAALLVPAAAQQPYAHFLTPSIIPLTLALCSLRLPALSRRRLLVGQSVLVGGVIAAGLVARVAGVDWVPALASAWTNVSGRDLASYYGGSMGVLTRQADLEAWQDTFDARVDGDRKVASWISTHGYSGASAVVWSSDSWPYIDAGLDVLLPSAPIYNDEVLLGNQGQVADQVRAIDPEVIVTSDDSLQNFPEVQPLLTANYSPADREGLDTVWLRNADAVAG